jgi:hypothetical protein
MEMKDGEIIYIVLSTLSETSGEAPESYCYLPLNQKLDLHLDRFTRLVAAAIQVGWLERRSGPVLRITDAGRRLVKDVENAANVRGA